MVLKRLRASSKRRGTAQLQAVGAATGGQQRPGAPSQRKRKHGPVPSRASTGPVDRERGPPWQHWPGGRRTGALSNGPSFLQHAGWGAPASEATRQQSPAARRASKRLAGRSRERMLALRSGEWWGSAQPCYGPPFPSASGEWCLTQRGGAGRQALPAAPMSGPSQGPVAKRRYRRASAGASPPPQELPCAKRDRVPMNIRVTGRVEFPATCVARLLRDVAFPPHGVSHRACAGAARRRRSCAAGTRLADLAPASNLANDPTPEVGMPHQAGGRTHGEAKPPALRSEREPSHGPAVAPQWRTRVWAKAAWLPAGVLWGLQNILSPLQVRPAAGPAPVPCVCCGLACCGHLALRAYQALVAALPTAQCARPRLSEWGSGGTALLAGAFESAGHRRRPVGARPR